MAIFARCSPVRRFVLRRRVFIAGVLVCALCLWGYVSWRFRVIGTVAHCVSTGRIANVDLLLRTRTPEDDTLLIGFVGASDIRGIEPTDAESILTWPVYRFDPKKVALDISTYDEWKNASGEINYRFFQNDIAVRPFKRDIETCLLSINGSPISTAGPYAIDIDVSPDGKFVNVISANGRRTKGDFFWGVFGGGGGYPRGPYYHEVFERLTGKKIGSTFTLKDQEPLGLSFCWEAKGKYVAYFDGRGKYLWVVPGPNLNTQPN